MIKITLFVRRKDFEQLKNSCLSKSFISLNSEMFQTIRNKEVHSTFKKDYVKQPTNVHVSI